MLKERVGKEKAHRCKKIEHLSLRIVLLNLRYRDQDDWGWHIEYFQSFHNGSVKGVVSLVPCKFCYGCGKKLEIPKSKKPSYAAK